MIDKATIDRILDAVQIEEVIGDFVALRKRGSDYKGLCPFHEDRNPSMSVSPARGIFKCFSCGKAGTALSFIMDHEHMSYPDALKYLANKYHIEIVEKQESAEEVAGRLHYESLQVVSDYAAKFFQNVLWNSEEGNAIGLSYFRSRNFSEETIRKFGLGYASGKQLSLAKEALKNGYKAEYLVETSLCVQRDNGSLGDRFYERVMFPIHSISGRVIAFGGRTLKKDKEISKYVNSNDSEIYHKSFCLYGLYFAKSAISKKDKCILVEGYADVISMHQLGIENVVASSGTSLTKGQIHLIKRFTENVTVLYDGDEPGIKASLRGTDLLLEEGMKVRVVILPPEDDPDSFANSHTKDEFLEYIDSHECDFITHKSNILSKGIENDPYKRKQLIDDIVKSISVIPDPVLRKVYVDQIAEQYHQSSEVLLKMIVEFREKKRQLEVARKNVEAKNEAVDTSAVLTDENISQYEQVSVNRYEITDQFLEATEKELVTSLLKFGCYPLYFEKDMTYGATAVAGSITVQEYIKTAMDEDELSFKNLLYREMYDEFYQLLNTIDNNGYKEKQSHIVRYFMAHENTDISKCAVDIMCSNYQLTIKSYVDAIAPDEFMLASSIPKTVMRYKSKVIDQTSQQLLQEITKAQKDGNTALETELVGQLHVLNQVKNQLAKEIKKIQ